MILRSVKACLGSGNQALDVFLLLIEQGYAAVCSTPLEATSKVPHTKHRMVVAKADQICDPKQIKSDEGCIWKLWNEVTFEPKCSGMCMQILTLLPGCLVVAHAPGSRVRSLCGKGRLIETDDNVANQEVFQQGSLGGFQLLHQLFRDFSAWVMAKRHRCSLQATCDPYPTTKLLVLQQHNASGCNSI